MKQLLFTYLITLACSFGVLPAKSQSRFYTKNGIPYFPISDTVPSSGTLGAIYINNTDKTIYRYNGKKWVAFCSGSRKPSATGVTITSDATTTSIVIGDYTYVADDYQNASEGTSTYQWYWATDNLGTNKTAISGATSTTYDVDIGEVYIAFGVTPISSENTTGNETISNWQKVSATDTASDGTKVVDMISTSGRIWMDRNLGASQAADSATDYNAYGSLFQWCRAADGHQLINWTNDTTGTAVNGTTSTLSDTTAPSHSLFIIAASSPSDWLSSSQSDGSLWWNGSSVGANNPCPTGYHVPTETEWSNELSGFSDAGGQNTTGAYNLLKLLKSGLRNYGNGSLSLASTRGCYWCTTGSSTVTMFMDLKNSSARMNGAYKSWGMSVRCIKDE